MHKLVWISLRDRTFVGVHESAPLHCKTMYFVVTSHSHVHDCGKALVPNKFTGTLDMIVRFCAGIVVCHFYDSGFMGLMIVQRHAVT